MEITSLLQLVNSIFGTSVTSSDGTVYYLYLIFGFILFVIFIKLLLRLFYAIFNIN